MGLRQDQLADEIRDILAMNFQGGKLSDPRLESVTITAVKLTADLQQATVYYRTYADADGPRAQKGLESAAGRLRRELSRVLDVRRVPELRFIYDTSVEYASRIESVISEIHQRDEKDDDESNS